MTTATFILVATLVPATALADDTAVAVTTTPKPRETETTTKPEERPVNREPTAADVAGAPIPGFESGKIVDDDTGDSTLRQISRGVLFVPKLGVIVAMAPLRGAVWAEERYQLETLYYRVFYNDARTIGLFPTATFESGFGLNVGAGFVALDLLGERESLAMHATTGGAYRQSYAASLGSGNRLGRLWLGVDSNFDRRPANPFYGIGNGDVVAAPATPVDPRTDSTAVATYHRYQEERVAATADLHVTETVHVRGTGALTDLTFGPSTSNTSIDTVYDTAGVVGFDGVRHEYGELELRLDHRRRATQWEPKDLHAEGWLADAFAGRVHRLDRGVDFWRYGAELQQYWRITSGPRVIATRFHAEAVTGSRDEVPFTELPMLGGGTFLRGYTFERFRDRVAAVGTVQYMWDIAHTLDAELFVDAGRVYSSLDNVSLDHMRVGYGVGLELHKDRGFIVETSLASSIEGGLFVSLSFNPVLDARPRWR